MTEPIRTFSGAHPFRPQCVVTAALKVFEVTAPDYAAELSVVVAERVTTDIHGGLCPRCHDPLSSDLVPEGWRPAGSRAVSCRCVPVCETCSGWIEPSIGTSPVTTWPTSTDSDDDGLRTRKDAEAARVVQLKAMAKTAVLEVGPDGMRLLDETGVMVVRPRPHPGGWLEYGYDDTADEQERGR
ncbi:hypothetical protein ACFU51_04830 [Streptomyces sp. NPDC057430]|uniref:hypothetical protein n=1 Tax=Streptomyces sp. NPDC057430 TaxID=3346131 RepID=UPI0036795437